MKWDFVGIVSADLEASVKFYRLLGCNFPDPNGEDHIEVTFESGMRLALDSAELMKKMGHTVVPGAQTMGLAFNAETPAKVDETYKVILAAGFKSATEPWDAFWGQRYAQVFDPDGNKVDIYANL